ncbi:EPL1 protein (cerato-platanin) [Colletotrichum graminicola]|nr:EPL1 protein (cerato-platanin) [Colletotrichum graminicola]
MATWELVGTTRFYLAIDGSIEVFVTSLRSMNLLTGDQARDFNKLEPLEVEATQVGMTNCGFAPTDFRKTSDEL